MEFTVAAKSFREAFNMVGRAVPAKTPKAVLLSVRVEADAEGLTLAGTDLEIGLRHRVESASVAEPGVVLLPRERVDAILRSAGDAELTFRSEGTRLSISAGPGARWTLVTEDPATFPEVLEWDMAEGSYWTIAAEDVRRLESRTTWATDPKSMNYALGGCLGEPGDRSFSLTATDARRLAHQSTPATILDDSPAPPGVLSKRFLEALAAVVEGEYAVSLGFPDDRTSKARCNGTQLWGRLVEGRFPDWRMVMPTDPVHEVAIPVAAFRRAVERAATLTSEESRRLDFAFGPGELRIRGVAADVGESDVSMPIGWASEAKLRVALNATYTLDILKAIGDGGEVTLGLIDARHNVTFRTADGFEGMLAAMTVEEPR